MQKETFLTAQGLKKITQELDELREKRKDIAQRIQEAKELGDLSENAEYHEAKNDQAFTEGRIAELEEIVRNAVVIKKPSKKNDSVQIGSTVKAKSQNGLLTYTIVGSNEASPTEGKISNESPLGKSFLGKRTGETVIVRTPKEELQFVIEEIN